MNNKQRHILSLRDTDIQGAVNRLCGDEALYEKCLRDFLKDTTMDELNTSIEKKSWDEAFTAAHALKGLAGNMGFIPLMHSTSRLVIVIRGGRLSDLSSMLEDVNSCYRDITDAIHAFIYASDNY